MDEPAEALEDLNKISPALQSLEFFETMADANYSLEKYSEALKCYNRLIELDPDNTEYYFMKSVSLSMTGEEKGEEILQTFKVALDKGFADKNRTLMLRRLIDIKDIPRFDKLVLLYQKQG